MQRKTKTTKKAFTIVELLTVMSIIIILISLLVPAMQKVQQFAREVRQNAQFHSITVGLDMYYNDTGEYPSSDATDPDGEEYCGAMKLAEAMVGQDMLGFHPDSQFAIDRQDAAGNDLYIHSTVTQAALEPTEEQNLMARKKPYIDLDQANGTRMGEIYPSFGAFNTGEVNDVLVLADVFEKSMNGDGEKHGMPILYYKANPNGNMNPNSDNGYDVNSVAGTRVIYDYVDNDELVQIGVPFDAAVAEHPMDSTNTAMGGYLENFYWRINNDDIKVEYGRPYKADTYILLSAGEDGLYGTRDDIYNFQKK